MAKLKMLKGPEAGQVFDLDAEARECVLGREPACSIVMNVAMISRRHACFRCQEGKWYVEDLKSRNGTFVNGKRIEGEQRIDEQDRLKFGELLFTFHEAEVPDSGGREPKTVAGSAPTVQFDMSDDDSSQSHILASIDSSSGSTLRVDVKPEAKLRAVLEITNNLHENIVLNDVLPKILDSLLKIFTQADRGFILLRDAESGQLVPKAVQHRHRDSDSISVSRTIVGKAMSERKAILSTDASSDSRFDASQSIADFQIRSLMCAPLLTKEGEAQGVIQVDSQDVRRQFSQEDLDVLAAVANQASISVQNAYLYERILQQERIHRDIEFAKRVQQGFLPQSPPDVPGYSFYDFYQPARTIGGDYFDYIPLTGGRVGILCADVAGKGISAALLMARGSAETRYNLAAAETPAAAITALNASLASLSTEGKFITFVLVIVDPVKHEATVVNAGHMAPMIRRAGGKTVEKIGEEQTGVPLGVIDGFEYEQVTTQIGPGDTVVLYTDGVSEAMNSAGELFDTIENPRIERTILQGEATASAIGERLVGEVRAWAGRREQSDDICLVTFGRNAD